MNEFILGQHDKFNQERINQAKANKSTMLDFSLTRFRDLTLLQELYDLEYLYLNSSEVTDLSPIKYLKNLKRLYLNKTKIIDFSPLQHLQNLQILDVSNTNISNISVLQYLKKLQTLYLSRTLVIELDSLEELSNLQYIDLRFTQVKDLSPLKSHIQKGLTISVKPISSYPAIYVENCPLIIPPISILNKDEETIINYFKQIQEQGTEPIYEARILIVGEPGAGKTSLMKKLINPEYQINQNNSESTIGINIHEGWDFKFKKNHRINFKANLWDFGGQEIQYMTHQFFLSGRSLYILLADNRTQNTNFPYWFEIINLLGKDEVGNPSPILVILNENHHKSVTNYDHDGYCKRYEGTEIKCYNLDLSKSDGRFEKVYEEIQIMLSNLKHIGERLPKLWQQIRKELKIIALKKNYISDEEFKEICNKNRLKSSQDIKYLSSYLHDLGVILHFQNDIQLNDFIILNPQWAVDAVYCILQDERISKSYGKFDTNFLNEIWSEKYNNTEKKNFLNLMMKDSFEICYQISKDKFVAPQFLRDVQINIDWDNNNSLKFCFFYEFRPKGILTRLIVRFNEYIAYNGKEALVSKKNAVFEKDECKIWVKESDFENKGEIRIEVSGNNYHRRHNMWWIRNEILQIHDKWFNSLRYEQMIPCNCNECKKSKDPYYHEFTYVQKCEEKKKSDVECKKSMENISILHLIEGIYTEKDHGVKSFFDRIESLADKIIYTNLLVENFSKHESETICEHIDKKFRDLESKLPSKIIEDWKKANVSNPYKADIKGKLKLTVPLLPLISFEKEVNFETKKIFDAIWNDIKEFSKGNKSFKELFIETSI